MRLGLILSLLLMGCTGKSVSCGKKALLLWPNAQGSTYTFQTITLSTLGSLYKLSGEAAQIYFEAGLDNVGFQGPVAEPKLTGAGGGVCVPEDVGSAMALNAYAQFERLYLFEKRLGTDRQLAWPRKVGVEIHLLGDFNDTHNNAHYYGAQDVITLVPYTKDKLPVELNMGIVAHEHFHAHFQHEVIARVDQALPTVMSSDSRPITTEDLDGIDPHSNNGVNNFTIRAWNEGLADFFASIYMDRTDFFSVSIAAPDRDLAGPLISMMDGAQMWRASNAVVSEATGATVQRMVGVAYGQGTQLARVLWRLAHSGPEPPDVFLARIMNRLQAIPAMVLPYYGAQNLMDVDAILPVLLKDFPLNAAACAQLATVSSVATMQKGFPSCSAN